MGTATVTINRSSIYSNSADDSGGGISVAGNGTAIVNNSSIYSNTASIGGGAQTSSFGTLKLNHVTITDNEATFTGQGVKGGGIYAQEGTFEMRNSIVFGNTNENCQLDSQDVTVNVNSGNIIGPGSSSNCRSNQIHDDPMLPASASTSRGSTPLFPLPAGSRAIDKVDCLDGIPAEDQRGTRRPQGLRCDIGAYEWYPPPPSSSAEGRTEFIPTPRPTAVVGTSVSTCPQLPADIVVVFGYAEGTQCQVGSGPGDRQCRDRGGGAAGGRCLGLGAGRLPGLLPGGRREFQVHRHRRFAARRLGFGRGRP